NRFLKEFLPFERRIAHYGVFNSLSQTLVKITSPGVPDFYQGSELWDLSLVDPDNRRPVDFGKRRDFLSGIKEMEKVDILKLIDELISTKEDGRIKLFLIYRALKARNERRALFERGDYIRIRVRGRHSDHVLAFARRNRNEWSITVVPRFLTYLVKEDEFPIGREVWGDTSIVIPEDASSLWRDAFTDQTVKGRKKLAVGEVLKRFPVALLLGE
ncbi:MAG TPA: malto-oligosyltrehalose synthase, partial [Thermodesulfobacteriota bacterium]|nr:malto-oligosyltrehalose synthase [Thermodesulfobacteriota bacterium]